MMKEAIGTGSSIEEALSAAKAQLGVSEEAEVEFEVLEYQQKKTLGLFGGKPAKVRAYIAEAEGEAAGGKANEARNFVLQVIRGMNIPGVTVATSETASGVQLNIDGEEVGRLIGRRGETLDALQYLTGLAVNRGNSDYRRIILNIGNYREKRTESMQALAKRIAASAQKTGRATALEPMSPYERRMIHTVIQDMDGITSWSVGEEPNRCVVIGPESRKGERGFSSRSHDSRRDGYGNRDRGGYNRDRGGNSRGGGDRRGSGDRGSRRQSAPAQPKSDFPPKSDSAAPLYGRIDIE